MPALKPYTIGVKVSSGTASDVYVNLRNGRTRDYCKVKTVDNEVVITLTDLTSNGTKSGTHTAYANSDIIEVNVTGYRYGGTTHIVDTTKGTVRLTLTLTDVSTTNAPAVSF